ncbi:MAG TPA: hypothetical protein VN540_06415, partial [Clostridia bacterium]|nr:hypothetical protein [Clostridia bacterium]
LRALCAEGYIDEIGDAERGARAKRTYHLLPRGLEALRAWLAKPVEKESLRFEILLKTYFSHLIAPEIMREHVQEFRRAHERDLATLLLFERELKAVEKDDAAHPSILRVIDFGVKANRAYLAWCDETERYLEAKHENEA